MNIDNHICLFRTLSVTIKAGETVGKNSIDLPKGEKIVAAAKSPTSLSRLLNLGLFEQGQEINTPMDVNFWRDREIGNHLIDGFVPVNSDGSSEIEAHLITPNGPLSADVTIQVVFVIVQLPSC